MSCWPPKLTPPVPASADAHAPLEESALPPALQPAPARDENADQCRSCAPVQQRTCRARHQQNHAGSRHDDWRARSGGGSGSPDIDVVGCAGEAPDLDPRPRRLPALGATAPASHRDARRRRPSGRCGRARPVSHRREHVPRSIRRSPAPARPRWSRPRIDSRRSGRGDAEERRQRGRCRGDDGVRARGDAPERRQPRGRWLRGRPDREGQGGDARLPRDRARGRDAEHVPRQRRQPDARVADRRSRVRRAGLGRGALRAPAQVRQDEVGRRDRARDRAREGRLRGAREPPRIARARREVRAAIGSRRRRCGGPTASRSRRARSSRTPSSRPCSSGSPRRARTASTRATTAAGDRRRDEEGQGPDHRRRPRRLQGGVARAALRVVSRQAR